jgi:glycosyltransferase involved in cell wall biosynthesis
VSLRIAMTFPLSLGTPGGGPQDCFELCRNMSLAGADVTLLAVAGSTSRFPRPALSPENSGAAQAAQLAEAGVRVIHVPPHPIHFRLDGLPMRKAVKRLLSERDFDVLIGWWHEASFLHSLTRARRMVFAINAAASYRHIYERLRRRKVGWLLSGPLRKADVIFVRSDFTQRELVECVGVEDRHVRKIHCGVRPGFFEVPRSVPEKIDRLVYFGSLTPAKGVFDLIAALGRLTDQDLGDWRLRIIGFGDQDPVRAAAREHGVIDRVEILGGLGPEELMGQLEWARMAVLPSRSESFGLAGHRLRRRGGPRGSGGRGFRVVGPRVAHGPPGAGHRDGHAGPRGERPHRTRGSRAGRSAVRLGADGRGDSDRPRGDPQPHRGPRFRVESRVPGLLAPMTWYGLLRTLEGRQGGSASPMPSMPPWATLGLPMDARLHP